MNKHQAWLEVKANLLGLLSGAGLGSADLDGAGLDGAGLGGAGLNGAGSFDSVDRGNNFLVNGVSVGGRRSFRGVHSFFGDGDLGILVLVTTLSFHSAVHDEGEDPNHPEENSHSAAWIKTLSMENNEKKKW